MPLQSGTSLGHFEILSAIGVGGMGEVYKARDSRLNRTVAIKVLPAQIADRPELKQRFEREAQTIAGLDHPHICVVHDVGSQDGIAYLVMEYLEGQTLAERIAKGPIPLDQLLTYAMQIADALDKAHRHGVTHGDLKPGNIMITKTGLKLLDFGLAKLHQPAPVQSQSAIPTVASASQPLTMEGTILGTLQYMSPEQLEGKEADARSDIFAFGTTLYEMATGRRAFEGKSQVSLMAAILEHEPPPVSALQPVMPPLLDEVIKICMAKNPENRWQNAADLLHELKLLARYGSLSRASAKPKRWRELAAWVSAGVLLIAMVSSFFWSAGRATEAPAKMSFQVETPSTPSPLHVSLSPTGRHLAAIIGGGGGNGLWVRPLEHLTGNILPGTERAAFPFWAPDGRFVAFFADAKLKKVDIFGSPPQILADAANGFGGTWNREGFILFAPTGTSPLFRVSASGGIPVQVTELDPSRGQTAHRHPRFLPDGVHFIYVAVSSKSEESGIYMGSLESKESKRLLLGNVKAEFAPPDHLLFVRETTLMAQRFDTSQMNLVGDPFPIADGVGINTTNSLSGFSVSDNGMLAYRSGIGAATSQLTWFDRTGKTVGTVGEPDRNNLAAPELSPDGRRVAVDRTVQGNVDVWLIDLLRGGTTRFTFNLRADSRALWSPDGKQIAFRSGPTDLYVKPSGGAGAEELLLKSPYIKTPFNWSADGRFLLFNENNPKTPSDLWALPMQGDRKPLPVVANSPFFEGNGQFSSDGRWVAYQSNESGRSEIYVVPFPPGAGKWQVSTSGGIAPRWRHDGKELFFIAPDGRMMAATVSASGTSFEASPPVALFQTRIVDGPSNIQKHQYAVSADGRFLINVPAGESTAAPMTLILNWNSPAN